MNPLKRIPAAMFIMATLLVSGCAHTQRPAADPGQPEVLTIYPDGSMKLMNRSISADDVVIYSDGNGGEKAALKVRITPLHPEFYRATIIVKRIKPEETGPESTD